MFRAYVPLGFMPASGTPFLLEICPAGLSAQLPPHHGHHSTGNHAHFEHCPFGSIPAGAPISHVIAFDGGREPASQPLLDPTPLQLGVRLQRAHRARAPPILA